MNKGTLRPDTRAHFQQAPIGLLDDDDFQKRTGQEPLDKRIIDNGHDQGFITPLQFKVIN